MLMSPARNARASQAPNYERHMPEQTLLYQLAHQHYPVFKSSLEDQGQLHGHSVTVEPGADAKSIKRTAIALTKINTDFRVKATGDIEGAYPTTGYDHQEFRSRDELKIVSIGTADGQKLIQVFELYTFILSTADWSCLLVTFEKSVPFGK